jgi:hypothetical protein
MVQLHLYNAGLNRGSNLTLSCTVVLRVVFYIFILILAMEEGGIPTEWQVADSWSVDPFFHP